MRRFPFRMFGVLVAILTVSACSAQSTPAAMSEATYKQLVREYSSATSQPLDAATATSFKQRFAQATTVVRPSGEIITPDNAVIQSALDKAIKANRPTRVSTENVSRAKLLDSLNRVGNGKSDRDAAQLAAQILRDKEFREAAKPKYEKNWIEELQEKIAKAVNDFFRWLFQPRGGWQGGGAEWWARLIQGILIVFAVVVVLVGLYYLIRWAASRNPAFRRQRELLSNLDLLEKDLPDPLGASRALATQGDYRAALRLAYIASLRQLATNGLVILQENKTNWEYQRDLNRRSQIAYATLLPATRLFDIVWYGQRRATPEEYEAVVRAHDALSTISADTAARDATTKGNR